VLEAFGNVPAGGSCLGANQIQIASAPPPAVAYRRCGFDADGVGGGTAARRQSRRRPLALRRRALQAKRFGSFRILPQRFNRSTSRAGRQISAANACFASPVKVAHARPQSSAGLSRLAEPTSASLRRVAPGTFHQLFSGTWLRSSDAPGETVIAIFSGPAAPATSS